MRLIRILMEVMMGMNDLHQLARERWGKSTAFRVGIVAGEVGLRMVNPYHGRQASLYRQGLRRGKATSMTRPVWFYWEVMG